MALSVLNRAKTLTLVIMACVTMFSLLLVPTSQACADEPENPTYESEWNGGSSQLFLQTLRHTVTLEGNNDLAPTTTESVIDAGTYTVPTMNDVPGYEFVGWNTADDGTGTDYAPGDVLTMYAPLTLYAQWMSTVDLPGSGLEGLPFKAVTVVVSAALVVLVVARVSLSAKNSEGVS